MTTRRSAIIGRMRAASTTAEGVTPFSPASSLAMARLVVPEGEGKQAEVLGEGAAAAPRVVEVLREIGVLA